MQNLCNFVRAFMWRKIESKSTFVEKKMTNMRSAYALNGRLGSFFESNNVFTSELVV